MNCVKAGSQVSELLNCRGHGGGVSKLAFSRDMKSGPEPINPRCNQLGLIQGSMRNRLAGVTVDRIREERVQRSRKSATTIPDLVDLPALRPATAVGALDATDPFNAAALAGDEIEGQGESMPVQSRSFEVVADLCTTQACTPTPTSGRATRVARQGSQGYGPADRLSILIESPGARMTSTWPLLMDLPTTSGWGRSPNL